MGAGDSDDDAGVLASASVAAHASRDVQSSSLDDSKAAESAQASGTGKKKRKRNRKKKNKGADDSRSVIDSELSPRSRSTMSQLDGDDDERDFTPLKEKLNDSFFEDNDSSEDEGMPDYKIGGYHPIHVGEILLDRYVIIQKLGWGHFSTVWLTKDLKFGSYVAIKVQKSAQHYLEAAYDEVEILDQVARNWKSKEWVNSIDGYYKDDKDL